MAINLTLSVQSDSRGHCNPVCVCFSMFISIMLYFLIIYLDVLYYLCCRIVNKYTYIEKEMIKIYMNTSNK